LRIFISKPKYRPAGPPPMQTIFMGTPVATSSLKNSLDLNKMTPKRENPDDHGIEGAQ
jgi:hypothetical protein